MPILSTTGRRTPKAKALFAGMYLTLAAGSAAMVYPFLLLLSGSTKSAVDGKQFDAVPRFLVDDTWLYRKHIEGLFNENLLQMNMAYDSAALSFESLEPPAGANRLLAEEWLAFVRRRPPPPYSYTRGYMDATTQSRTIPSGLREFKEALRREYGGEIERVNEAFGVEFLHWNTLTVRAESFLLRREKPASTGLPLKLEAFKTGAPEGLRYYFSPSGLYRHMFLRPRYGSELAAYNRAHGSDYRSWSDVPFARRCPSAAQPRQRAEWEEFVRHSLALHWIRIGGSAREAFARFLRAKYPGIDALNRTYGSRFGEFGAVPLHWEAAGCAATDLEAFVTGWRDPDSGMVIQAPAEALEIASTETQFQDYVQEKYRTLASANAALGTNYSSFTEVRIPQRDVHAVYFAENRSGLRWEFVSRNYKAVAEYILFRSRGIWNTAVYCTLAVAFALLVNPLAAYAMSRYQLPSTYKILLLLMCTMAFPPMVTQIPSFLMLRHLGLLNTFAALLLPTMANGYMTFLLKGFFDSLPRELYESAVLDGAGEWTIFWRITMNLSKPILAVVALQAFNVAYSNFMFAFIVCQDERMWTLTVWLYQLQQRSGPSVMYAALMIAAVPTLLIFLFAQNVIMRGIVVPSEK